MNVKFKCGSPGLIMIEMKKEDLLQHMRVSKIMNVQEAKEILKDLTKAIKKAEKN